MPFVAVTLLQSAQSILTQFSSSLQQRAIANFKASGVDVRLGVAVTCLSRDEIELRGGEKIPYGICVWSTGGCRKHCCLLEVEHAVLS
jgi:NADH:ubiquinone reductase (non-electrogenic)